MNPIVALYARSSKDRADVSCEAQIVELSAAVTAKGEAIYHIYQDKALSSTRDDLPSFTALLEAAGQDPLPFTKIYCLDTGRIARDTYHAQSVKHWLRKKRGIELIFLHMPKSGTYMDEAFEKMMEVWDELHSRVSKEKAILGQKQNIRKGYRAGGPAPFGYRRKTEILGIHRDGHKITKTVNEIDPVTGPIATEYFQRRARGESRNAICRDFTRRELPGASGVPRWSQGTCRSLEENLDAYLGHLIYNRHQERLRDGGFLGGQKFRPRTEWVILENAHPALTTPDVVLAVRARLRTYPPRRGLDLTKRPYILSTILICASCGSRYQGDRGFYRCATRTCQNGSIAQSTIERIVATVIEEDFLTPERLRTILRRARARQVKWRDAAQGRLPRLERELAHVERQLLLLWDRHCDGSLTLDQYRHLNGPLWLRKERLGTEITVAHAPIEVNFQAEEEQLRKAIKDAIAWLQSGDTAKRRTIMEKLFQTIKLGPRQGTTRIWQRSLEIISNVEGLTRVLMVAPTGLEPVFRP